MYILLSLVCQDVRLFLSNFRTSEFFLAFVYFGSCNWDHDPPLVKKKLDCREQEDPYIKTMTITLLQIQNQVFIEINNSFQEEPGLTKLEPRAKRYNLGSCLVPVAEPFSSLKTVPTI